MGALKTRADSIREYLTGATSDGGTQSSPVASLGNFRSSTEAASMGILLVSPPIANVTVDFASGLNNPGNGTLTCIDANTLQWQDFNGVAGIPVAISNGQSVILEAGTSGEYIRVTRTSATALAPGTATVTLSILFNNQFGMDNVASADATAGINEYFASIIRSEAAGGTGTWRRWLATLGNTVVSDVGHLGATGAGTINSSASFATWPSAGWVRIETSSGTLREIAYYTSKTVNQLTVPSAGRALLGSTAGAGSSTDNLYSVPGVAIAADPAGVYSGGGSIQTIANRTTAPTGVTWVTGIREATGLSIGPMTNNQQAGIWVWRDIPAGAVASGLSITQFNTKFDSA